MYESNSILYCIQACSCLTLSQTSPVFYVSSVDIFWKHCGKRRNKQFLLSSQCFLTVWRTFCHFHQIQNCRLQTLSIWKSLKFVIWERVNILFISCLYFDFKTTNTEQKLFCINLNFETISNSSYFAINTRENTLASNYETLTLFWKIHFRDFRLVLKNPFWTLQHPKWVQIFHTHMVVLKRFH